MTEEPTNLSETTRRRVLEAAGEVFGDVGFETATVREICRKAGVKNIAAINYYFGDKEQLYVAAVREALEGTLREVPLPTWEPGTPPAVKLREYVRVFLLRALRKADWHCRLMMRETVQPTEACHAFVENYAAPSMRMLQGILAELLPPGVPDRKRRLIAFSVVGQCLFYRVGRNIASMLVGEAEFQGLDLDTLVEHITSFTLAAIEGVKP